jgi:hypothetical protein
MSGSKGQKSAESSREARSPRAGNQDTVERHREEGMPSDTGTSAEESARGTRTGSGDSRRADPDAPTESRPRREN